MQNRTPHWTCTNSDDTWECRNRHTRRLVGFVFRHKGAFNWACYTRPGLATERQVLGTSTTLEAAQAAVLKAWAAWNQKK